MNDVTFHAYVGSDVAEVHVMEDGSDTSLAVTLSDDESTPTLELGRWLDNPIVTIGTEHYRIRVVEAGDLQPVVFRRKPREIVVNIEHPALRKRPSEAVRLAVVLETAYLSGPSVGPEDLYDRVLAIAAAEGTPS
jgi:hypothetical protein